DIYIIYRDNNIINLNKQDNNKQDNVTIINAENEKKSEKKFFTPPTVEEIQAYIDEKKYNVDAEQFFLFYDQKNWMVGKNKMSKWHSAVALWNNRETKEKKIRDEKDYRERLRNGDVQLPASKEEYFKSFLPEGDPRNRRR
ncbi:MAG: hypothetical protein LUB83_00045, partial [Prevotellaceae bacterium]|nr:hypothetical protein [Prevotellaceae bacterium]